MSMTTNSECLEAAISITKAYAGATTTSKAKLSDVLEDTYKKIKVLLEDARN